MKRFLFTCCLVIGCVLNTFTQCPEGLYISTQAQVDSFATDYAGCTEIPKWLIINGSDITDLSGLSGIVSVAFDLQIKNTSLINLEGLETLKTLNRDLIIENNPLLTDISAISDITQISRNISLYNNISLVSLASFNISILQGYLRIEYNNSLTSFSGLENITQINNNLVIKRNKLLNDITSLSNLTSIVGELNLSENESLTNLSGLENLNTVGNLYIYMNNKLSNLSGIQGLTSVTGYLKIESNDKLSDISNLIGITSIGTNLSITSNPALINLSGIEDLNYLSGYISISGNGSLTTISGFNNIIGSIDYVEITGNSALTEISGFNSITNLTGSPKFSGNKVLNTISGFNNLVSTSTLSFSGNILSTISGFNSLATINGDFNLGYYNNFFSRGGNVALSNISGLSSLKTIKGGFLSVDNDILVDFDGLQSLETIEGDFRVFYNDKLENFNGFDSLTSIQGSVQITENPTLKSLFGLDNLYTIDGTFGIYSNDSLVTLQALNNLNSVGGNFGIGIYESPTGSSLGNNPVLEDVPLAQLVSVGENFKIQNNAKIISLDNINSLESVGGEIYIRGNSEMISISGFNKLVSVTDDIIIDYHAGLNSISGFNSLINIGSSLEITNNGVLKIINGFSNLNTIGDNLSFFNNISLDNLIGFSELLTINGNVSIELVSSLTNMKGFNSLAYIGQNFYIQDNANLVNLKGLENLNEIAGTLAIGALTFGGSQEISEGNDSLINLDGLQSLHTINGVVISENKSLKNFYGLGALKFVNGNFHVSSNEVLENFKGLEGLENCIGDLRIHYNPKLINLKGLDNLRKAGQIEIILSPLMEDFTGLESLEEINGHIESPGIQPGGNFSISSLGITSLKGLSSLKLVNRFSLGSCPNIVSFYNDLNSLNTINWLTVSQNNSLTSLGDLESLETIDQLVILNNPSFSSLGGLSHLKSANFIRIDYNDELVNLSGLESLTTLKSLRIAYNKKLTDLSGIANYDHNIMTGLSIFNNTQLAVCNEISICNYMARNGVSAILYGNADGCNRADVIESCANGNNTILGKVNFDFDKNGCDNTDIAMDNVPIRIFDETNEYKTYTNSNGEYSLFTSLGSFTTKVKFEDGIYMSSPLEQSIEFSTGGNTKVIDFCATSDETINDLNISIIPMGETRPGFNQSYRVIYENVGTTLLSGDISFQFDESSQTFISVLPNTIKSETSNKITVSFTDLYPFEKERFLFTMNTLPPPTVNDGDIIEFSASINDINDTTPTDNTFNLKQSVVNSFDPNDKSVLQGELIDINDASEYLHYVIRFQNTGSASAINVSIKDILSDKLDWETFKPVTSSHSYKTKVTNGNYVEFEFNGIDLPAQQDDETGSNGLVAFKIKPKDNIAVNDIIFGKADIFFDFNSPITTNTVSTKYTSQLSIPHTEQKTITIYPLPSKGLIHIKPSKSIKIDKVEVFSVNGSLLIDKKENLNFIDISNLSKGIYFLKLQSSQGYLIKKIIKN